MSFLFRALNDFIPIIQLKRINCETQRCLTCSTLSPFFFSIVKPTRCINVSNLFCWSNTLHVSDGLSVHHQEFKTVRTATDICQTDTAHCLLVSRQQYLFDICLLQYVQSLTPDDGRKDRPKRVECYSNKINLRH